MLWPKASPWDLCFVLLPGPSFSITSNVILCHKNLRELCHTQLVKRVSWSKGVQVPNTMSQILNPKSQISGPRSRLPKSQSHFLLAKKNSLHFFWLKQQICSEKKLAKEDIQVNFFSGWKKFGSDFFLVENKFLLENFVVEKKFWSKSLGSKQIWGQHKNGRKFLGVKQKLGEKICRSTFFEFKTNYGRKKNIYCKGTWFFFKPIIQATQLGLSLSLAGVRQYNKKSYVKKIRVN